MIEPSSLEETIFGRARKIESATERAAFLDVACGGDRTFRAKVEALLQADAQSFDLLDLPERLAATLVRPDADRPGTFIGPYELRQEIGEGGMGVVWMAEQLQPVRRQVALKILKSGIGVRQVFERFEAERQALALMDHPNIPKVHDAGTTPCGRPYFVMELVRGVPITEYSDRHSLTLRDRLGLFLAVCHAVQHAHQKGIIHRDLKPSNVLVAKYDGEPMPKVIDFGISKAIGQSLVERTTVTHDGQIIGTPEYMSPEQASISSVDIDTRSDIYSLGVLLYELLTGLTPIEKERLSHAAFDDVLRIVREEDPPWPSARLRGSRSLPSVAMQRGLEPARLVRMMRGDLDWIVMKCLEKDRSRRYETANGLARDIQRFLNDESVEASPPSTTYRLKKFWKRHRWPVLSACLILLLLVGGVIGTTIGLVQAEKRLVQIEKGMEILESIFEDLDPRAEEKEGRSLRVILGERLDRAAAELDGEAVGDPLVVARVQDRLGRTYLSLGQGAPAESLFAKAIATRTAYLGADHPLVLASMHNQALAFDSVGKPHEAMALLERVRNAWVEKLGAENLDTLSAENDLAGMYLRVARVDEAVTLLERVRDVRVAKLGADHAQTLATLGALADGYVGAGKGYQAVDLLKRVYEARKKQHGPAHPATLSTLDSLAFAYQSVGKMDQSVALFEQARDVVVPSLGLNHPQTLNVLDNLARLYRAFGRTDEAIALAEQVKDARIKILGAYHPHTIHTLDNLAQAYEAAEKPKQALPLLEQAGAGLETLKFIHSETGQIVGDLCRCLERLGQLDRSMKWRRKWLEAEREKAGPKSVTFAKEMVRVGDYLCVGGLHAEAEPILREALAILEKSRPEDWETAFARTLLGEALIHQKKYAEAEPLLIRGYEGLKAREALIPELLAGHLIAGAGESVGTLYDAWGRPEKATEWRSKLPSTGLAHDGHEFALPSHPKGQAHPEPKAKSPR